MLFKDLRDLIRAVDSIFPIGVLGHLFDASIVIKRIKGEDAKLGHLGLKLACKEH